MIKTRKYKGFTLIEVTLAIVIGIIMIAGATLIYNQAKNAAGNSKANEKVMALQSLVEQYAAQNQGIYPSDLVDVNILWARQRPDDFNKSPWGGGLGASYNTATAGAGGPGVGVAGDAAGLTTTVATPVGFYSTGAATNASTAGDPTDAAAVTDVTTTTPTIAGDIAGGLVYDYDPNNNSWTFSDFANNGHTTVARGYAVYVVDNQGRSPNFVTGGKTN